LTTIHKCLFTTVTIAQMTPYFLVTLGIGTHTFAWILTLICTV
jgi:hypothetical protein